MANVREAELLYGDHANLGLLRLLGPISGPVLDVGCGKGPLGPALRHAGGSPLVGLEPSERASEIARERYDILATSSIEEVTLEGLGGTPFSTIVCADVIEHLVDPWQALRKLRGFAAPGARIAVSTPNAQTWEIVWPLLRGRFDYDPAGGVLDSTHLRWFTRRSLHDTLRATGWRPLHDGGSWAGGPRRRVLRRLTGGLLDGFLYWQLFTVATAA